MAKGKYAKKGRSPINGMALILLILLLSLGSMLLWKGCSSADAPEDTKPEGTQGGSSFWNWGKDETKETTEPTTVSTEPFVTSTASVGVSGDMLFHGPCIEAAKQNDGTYDFSSFYRFIDDYYQKYDLMIANLEVTLGGEAAGPYKGYPTFNSPDSVVDALKGAGVDMLLTSNNHAYDTGHNGFIRTQQVLEEKGMLHLGSRLDGDTSSYIVQDVNGIKIGMACYTYESKRGENGQKYLNGIPVAVEDTNLISTFNYERLTEFYNEVKQTLADMEAEGADVTMLFLHWGNEYQRSPNTYQTAMSQELCNLGVDFIIGGHPHVIQPFTVLNSTTGDGHETYCIYSLGNAVSNQRRESLETVQNPQYTEDGMIFGASFEKWNDGTVNVTGIEVLPTWVDRSSVNGRRTYTIVPLDPDVDWTSYGVGTYKTLQASYDQTMELMQGGLDMVRHALGQEPLAPDTPNETTTATEGLS